MEFFKECDNEIILVNNSLYKHVLYNTQKINN